MAKLSVQFLQAFEGKFRKDGSDRFTMAQGRARVAAYELIGDPAYDGNLKKLWYDHHEIGGLRGLQRLTSLLNGFFYPDATEKDEQIRDVRLLSNELPLTSADNSSLWKLVCDVACECTSWKLDENGEKDTAFSLRLWRTLPTYQTRVHGEN
jgi:hypothetical protein